MAKPAGVTVTTVHKPDDYPLPQINRAFAVAQSLQVKALFLLEPPPHECAENLNGHAVCVICCRRDEP